MAPRVVNISTGAKFTHYCGRPTRRYYERNLNLGNPFIIGVHGNRDEVIAKFEQYARTNLDVLGRIKSIPISAVLGCYCAPLPCHVDVIIKIWRELHEQQ